MSGYFAVHRGVFDHPLFAREGFSEREAWIWLIGQAAWQPMRVRVGRGLFDLDRGQCAFALRFLAEKWQWSVSRVRGFLRRLEDDAMISLNSTREATLITVCNYNEYQPNKNTEQHADGTLTARSRHKEEEYKNLKTIGGGREGAPLVSPEANRLSDEIAVICGHDLKFLPPSWLGSPYRVQTWIANGWPSEIILATCREMIANKRDGPPNSINFFEKGIARAIARHNAPLPEVKIIEAQTVEVRRGTTENLAQTARRLAGSAAQLGPRPSLVGGGEDGNLVRLLPKGGG